MYWTRAFIRYNGMRHPRELGKVEVERFLAHIATERHVSVSTHKQASCAILFLYRAVLGQELPWMEDLGRPKSRVRVPTVLSREEVARLLGVMAPSGTSGLIARALYGTGMRLGECLQLRVKDVDFDRAVVVVRQGKGGKDRVVRLPEALRRNSSAHVKHGSGTGRRACRAWRCPMRLRSSCRMPANREVGSGSGRRALYRSIRVAVFGAGIISIARRSAAPLPARRARRESASSDRAYASALVCDASARVRRGHSTRAGIARTQRCEYDMIYTHVLKSGAAGTPSPLDGLLIESPALSEADDALGVGRYADPCRDSKLAVFRSPVIGTSQGPDDRS